MRRTPRVRRPRAPRRQSNFAALTLAQAELCECLTESGWEVAWWGPRRAGVEPTPVTRLYFNSIEKSHRAKVWLDFKSPDTCAGATLGIFVFMDGTFDAARCEARKNEIATAFAEAIEIAQAVASGYESATQ